MNTKWRLVQFSEVVVGNAHNPTILNPDFLATQRIVPKSWGWEVAETITTPPLAIVKYTNGVSITVEENKIQVTDPNVEDGIEKSRITDIAATYIEILPHVRYTAVGNNFQCVVPQVSPGDFLKERFLKNGAWLDAPSQLGAIGLKLRYPLVPVGHLLLTLDAAEAKLPDNAGHQEVIVCNANFSRECADRSTPEVAVDHLRKSMDDWNIYKQGLETLFDLKAGVKP